MSGNGVDNGAVYQLLRTVADTVVRLEVDVREINRKLDTKADKADVAGLRQAVTEYHSAVIGHGVLISELDDRLRRVERHLGLAASV